MDKTDCHKPCSGFNGHSLAWVILESLPLSPLPSSSPPTHRAQGLGLLFVLCVCVCVCVCFSNSKPEIKALIHKYEGKN